MNSIFKITRYHGEKREWRGSSWAQYILRKEQKVSGFGGSQAVPSCPGKGMLERG
jgi:hypothetical protein